MRIYHIPCAWQVYGRADVEANSLDEAIRIAEGDDFPLPEGDYLDDSFKVDRELAMELDKNKEEK